MPRSQGLINFLEWFTELRETLTFTSLFKYMIKDTDEQPDEQIHRERSGMVWRTELLSPWSWGAVTFPLWMCSPTQKISKPGALDIFIEPSYVRMINH